MIDIKQQVADAIAKFGEQLDQYKFSSDMTTMGEYLKQIQDSRKEGLVYQAFTVKHKTKRGYSPKTIKYRRLFGYYHSEIEINEGTITITNYIKPLPAVDKIMIKGLLNEGTKTV